MELLNQLGLGQLAHLPTSVKLAMLFAALVAVMVLQMRLRVRHFSSNNKAVKSQESSVEPPLSQHERECLEQEIEELKNENEMLHAMLDNLGAWDAFSNR